MHTFSFLSKASFGLFLKFQIWAAKIFSQTNELRTSQGAWIPHRLKVKQKNSLKCVTCDRACSLSSILCCFYINIKPGLQLDTWKPYNKVHISQTLGKLWGMVNCSHVTKFRSMGWELLSRVQLSGHALLKGRTFPIPSISLLLLLMAEMQIW